MFSRNISLILFFSFYLTLYAQKPTSVDNIQKVYVAQKATVPPMIDGSLDDQIWKGIPEATNFLMVEPGDGNPSRNTHPTSVKVVYDDEAIYIAAYLYDNDPQQIMRQFTQRDNLGQSDFFIIDINTYNDGENQTRFIITSAGALADARMTGESEDFAYNVVWEAEISFDENGWYAEFKIPYAALRFPKKTEQVWGIQFIREIKHLNEVYTWNYVNKSVGKFSQYTGILKGITNIEPPVRLSFYPYTSGEIDRFRGNTQTNFSAGLDFKYGITDAFTLDATLIPDFGQVAFDNVELNLGPFEQEFGENRAFFTEGTELFTKGNLFYSRRVGDAPIGFNDAQRELITNEVLIENPERANLINAIKISGRTTSDLGIGLFNAVTQEARAIYKDTISEEIRMRITEPLANYNIFVLDQQFNQSSSITLINTNVTREGNFRDANVTGLLFDVFNRENSFNFKGEAKVSNVNRGRNIPGFASNLEVARTKGQFRYAIAHELANETYDINDLGLNFMTNYSNFYSNISYQIFEPTKYLNNYRIRLYGRHQRRYSPNVYVASGVGTNFFAITKERFAFGGFLEWNTKLKDFFEPRIDGAYILYNPNLRGDVWISSDYRKRIAIDSRVSHQTFSNANQSFSRLNFEPRFRLTDKFTIFYTFNYTLSRNRNSYVTLKNRQSIFGNRDMESVENALRGSYNFTTKKAVNLSFRNFWSAASFERDSFGVLQNNGSIEPVTYNVTSQNDPNANFNIWNLDLSYSWQFAPGSEAILLYRNSIFNLDSQSELDYIESLENLFNQPLRQNLSLRIVYFIDYNNVKKIFKS